MEGRKEGGEFSIGGREGGRKKGRKKGKKEGRKEGREVNIGGRKEGWYRRKGGWIDGIEGRKKGEGTFHVVLQANINNDGEYPRQGHVQMKVQGLVHALQDELREDFADGHRDQRGVHAVEHNLVHEVQE
jgi:hypothetical protein